MTISRPVIHDPALVLATLGDFPDARITPITGGIDALMWRVDSGNQTFALRLLRADQHKQAQREAAMSVWAPRHGFPVPAVVTSSVWNDRPVALIEWAAGRQVAEEVLIASDPVAAARQFGEACGRMQARIHGAPLPSDPVVTERVWQRWSSTDPELAARLLAQPAKASCVIHLDFHPLNILGHRGEITAVLDWANVHIGDPRADLARTQALLQLAPLPQPEAAVLIRLFEQAWQAGYEATAGWFDIPPMYRWWAGETITRTLEGKIGDPAAPWLDETQINRIRQWVDTARAIVGGEIE